MPRKKILPVPTEPTFSRNPEWGNLKIPPLVDYTGKLGFGGMRILVQDHSNNPGGTIKDFRNLGILNYILGRAMNTDRLIMVTAGNAGYSAKLFFPNLEVVCLVDSKTHKSITRKMEKAGIILLNLDFPNRPFSKEQIRELVAWAMNDFRLQPNINKGDGRILSKDEQQRHSQFLELSKACRLSVSWRGTNGRKALPAPLEISSGFHDEYSPLAKSITNEVFWMKRHGKLQAEGTTYVVLPVGSGEVATGMYFGLLDEHGNMPKNVRLVGVRPEKNPSIADKLCGNHPPYGFMLEKIFHPNGAPNLLVTVGESQIEGAYSNVNNSKFFKCEHSAAAAFAAVPLLPAKENDIVVVINTGYGLAAKH